MLTIVSFFARFRIAYFPFRLWPYVLGLIVSTIFAAAKGFTALAAAGPLLAVEVPLVALLTSNYVAS